LRRSQTPRGRRSSDPTDAATFTATAAVLVLTIGAASFLPAWRATGFDADAILKADRLRRRLSGATRSKAKTHQPVSWSSDKQRFAHCIGLLVRNVCAAALCARRASVRLMTSRSARLRRQLFFPGAQRRAQLSHERRLCVAMVAALGDVLFQIEQQRGITVCDQLPSPAAHRLLLPSRKRQSPEECSIERRRPPGENRYEVDSVQFPGGVRFEAGRCMMVAARSM
jgi:hypothetical protein